MQGSFQIRGSLRVLSVITIQSSSWLCVLPSLTLHFSTAFPLLSADDACCQPSALGMNIDDYKSACFKVETHRESLTCIICCACCILHSIWTTKLTASVTLRFKLEAQAAHADRGKLDSMQWSDYNCNSCGGPFSSKCMVTKQPVPQRSCTGWLGASLYWWR